MLLPGMPFHVTDPLLPSPCGLHCASGGFHVDPVKPVPLAVVTHAHSDHAVRGCGAYLCSESGAGLLRLRVGPRARIETLRWGEVRTIGGVNVSLHPAGHVLGSAQVRVSGRGGTWVVSGDYKLEPDPSCEAFESVRCDVFLSECTFGRPSFAWAPSADIFASIHGWWQGNRRDGRHSLLIAYSLGKAQRLLASLDAGIGPIHAWPTVAPWNACYVDQGRRLAPCAEFPMGRGLPRHDPALLILPEQALERLLPSMPGDSWRLARVSGWVLGMGVRPPVDAGFALSDHADWSGILSALDATGARRVGFYHGSGRSLVRACLARGLDAWTFKPDEQADYGSEQLLLGL